MARFSRGPVIENLETAVFCLQAGDQLFFVSHLLPSAQFWSWPLAKIRTAVAERKLYFAEKR